MTADVSGARPAPPHTSARTIGGACGHEDGGHPCSEVAAVRHYLTGNRCPAHTPAAIAGRDDVTPDPELTLEATAAAAGRPIPALGPLPITPAEGARHAARGIRKPRR